MNLKNLTLTAFVAIVSGLIFNSCQTKNDGIDYKIKGNHVMSIESQDSPIAIKKSNYEKSGNLSVPYSKLNDQTLFSNLAIKDSLVTIKISNGNDSIKYYATINSEIICDTFIVLEKEEQYLVSGKVESKLEIVKNSTDTIEQIVNSTFIDTIYITNCKKNYAGKACFFVINSKSIKHHQKEIKELTMELVNKTASR